MSSRRPTTTNDDQCQTTDPPPPPLPFATFDLSSPRFDPSFLSKIRRIGSMSFISSDEILLHASSIVFERREHRSNMERVNWKGFTYRVERALVIGCGPFHEPVVDGLWVLLEFFNNFEVVRTSYWLCCSCF